MNQIRIYKDNRYNRIFRNILPILSLFLILTLWFVSPCSVSATENEAADQEQSSTDPLPAYYIVEPGDTLYHISKRFDVPRTELVRLNKLQNPSNIYAGQTLLLWEEQNNDPLHTQTDSSTYADGSAHNGPDHETVHPSTVAPFTPQNTRATEQETVFPESTTSGEAPFFLDVRDTDLRDVLSALAIRMGKTIILLDEPVKVSFHMEGTSPLVAMKLLLQREGYEYLEEGELIIVGRPDRLRSDFMDHMVISRFSLQYTNAATLLDALGQFGVAPDTFTVETNPRTFWAQGTPRELSRVREIVAALDRPENVHMEIASPLERFSLQYLSAATFEQFITQLGITVELITLPANPQVFWVQSAPHDLERLRDLIASLDRPENTGLEIKLDMMRFNLAYVPAATMTEYLVEAGVRTEDIRTVENTQAIWIYGPPQNLEIARELITTLDRLENAEVLPRIFVYSLRNISAAYAKERLDGIDLLPGVETRTFSFPEFSHELLVISPPHLQEQVYSILGQLDEARQRIRRPVDSASGANARNRLVARRELLAQLTGISISRMYISGNLSGDNESPYHILWVEETPDKIQQVLDMLAIIDAPRL